MSLKIENETETKVQVHETANVFQVHETENVLANLNGRYIWQQFFNEVNARIKSEDFGMCPMWSLKKTHDLIRLYLPKSIFVDADATLRECLWHYFPRSLLILSNPRSKPSPTNPPMLISKYSRVNFSSLYFDRKEFDAEKDTFVSLADWEGLWEHLSSPNLKFDLGTAVVKLQFVFGTAVVQAQECWIISFLSIPQRLPRGDGIVLRREVLARTMFPFDHNDREYQRFLKKQLEAKKQALEAEAKAFALTTATATATNNQTYSAMAGISGDSKANPGSAYSQFGKPVVPPKFTKPVVPLFAGKTNDAGTGLDAQTRSAGRSLKPRKTTKKSVKAPMDMPIKKKFKKFKIGVVDAFRTLRLWLALKRAWDAYHELPKKSSISIKLKKYLSQIELIMRRKRETPKARIRLLYYVLQAEHSLKEAGRSSSFVV